MASTYPTALDTWATNKQDDTDAASGSDLGLTTSVGDHATHHNDLADAVNKIETELGTAPSGAHSTVKDRLKVVGEAPLNLKDPRFGGVGDGTVDESAALTAAIAELPDNASANPGGEILIPRGVWKFTSSQAIQLNGLRLIGEGQSATILKPAMTSGYLFDVSLTGTHYFEGFTIDGGGISSTASTSSGSPNLTSVTPTTGWANGMAVQGPGIPAATTISSGAGTGTMVMSANATATATGITIGGVVVGAGASGTAAGIRLQGGVSRFRMNDVKIWNFTVNSDQFVMALEGALDNTFYNVIFDNNGQHLKLADNAAHTYPSNQNTFYSCTFRDTTWASGNALLISDSEGNVFEACLLEGNNSANTVGVINTASGNAPGRGNAFVTCWFEDNGNLQANSHGIHISGTNATTLRVENTIIEGCKLLSSVHDKPSVQIYMENALNTIIEGNYSNLGGPNKAVGVGAGESGASVRANSFEPSAVVEVRVEARGMKYPVRVAAPVNVTVASPGATIDGATMSVGPPKDRVLLANQTTPSQNGVYDWNGSAVPMTRSTDADTASELTDSVLVTVDEGTANKDSIFTLSTDKPITVGTTALRFTRIHPAAAVSSHPINSAYQPASSKLENLPRDTVPLANTAAITTQIIRVFPMGIQRAGDVLAALNFQIATTGAASVTNSWAGIARLSDRVILAISPTSTAAPAANTLKTFTFNSAFTADKDEVLLGFVMYQATTVPTFYGINHGNASIMTQAPVVQGNSTTGQTTPLTVGTVLAAFTADTEMIYCFAT